MGRDKIVLFKMLTRAKMAVAGGGRMQRDKRLEAPESTSSQLGDGTLQSLKPSFLEVGRRTASTWASIWNGLRLIYFDVYDMEFDI